MNASAFGTSQNRPDKCPFEIKWHDDTTGLIQDKPHEKVDAKGMAMVAEN